MFRSQLCPLHKSYPRNATVRRESVEKPSSEIDKKKLLLRTVLTGRYIHTKGHHSILGVTFDPLFMFAGHGGSIKKKLNRRMKVLKPLSNSSWRQEKETISPTYKVIGHPQMALTTVSHRRRRAKVR